MSAPEPRIDRPKLVAIGVLHMAQYFPATFTGVALPFILREEGLPLEQFWLLALPAVPRWLKWAMAIVVDDHGSTRFGYRKSWIAPTTALGAALYAWLAWIPPTLDVVGWVIGILVAKSFVMAFYDVAVDALATESMSDAERPTGTSIIVFLAMTATVLGAGSVAIVERFGWRATLLCASGLLLAAAAPALLRREPPPPEATRQRRARGERASLLESLRRPESRWILPYLFAFGFGGQLLISMLGPFFADEGLTLTDFGIVAVSGVLAGSGIAAAITPPLVRRYGMKRTALGSLSVLPLEAAFYVTLTRMEGLPPLPWLAAGLGVLVVGTSVYGYVVNNSRYRWPSKAQAATDFSLQSSVWNGGVWAAGSVSGFIVAAFGWTAFFPIASATSFAIGLFYVLGFDRMEELVSAREAQEEAAADAPGSPA